MISGRPLFKKQKNMGVVLTSLIPILIGSVYLYGYRGLALVVGANLGAVGAEYFFASRRNEPVTQASLVTGTLLGLTLPPSLPLWMAVLGGVIGIAFGKELFGGFGRNVYNPALVGRAFLFVTFPNPMTAKWSLPLIGGGGGFTEWASDTVTSATPLVTYGEGGEVDLLDLFFGLVPGSVGEGSAVLILLGGIYMVYKKVASWEIILSTVGGYLAPAILFALVGWGAPIPVTGGLLAGGLLFGSVYMATDPVSANATRPGKVVYGLIIGLCVALIRFFGNFPEGIMFAILLGNTFGPICEEALKNHQARAKERQSSEASV